MPSPTTWPTDPETHPLDVSWRATGPAWQSRGARARQKLHVLKTYRDMRTRVHVHMKEHVCGGNLCGGQSARRPSCTGACARPALRCAESPAPSRHHANKPSTVSKRRLPRDWREPGRAAVAGRESTYVAHTILLALMLALHPRFHSRAGTCSRRGKEGGRGGRRRAHAGGARPGRLLLAAPRLTGGG